MGDSANTQPGQRTEKLGQGRRPGSDRGWESLCLPTGVPPATGRAQAASRTYVAASTLAEREQPQEPPWARAHRTRPDSAGRPLMAWASRRRSPPRSCRRRCSGSTEAGGRSGKWRTTSYGPGCPAHPRSCTAGPGSRPPCPRPHPLWAGGQQEIDHPGRRGQPFPSQSAPGRACPVQPLTLERE